tara:strand:- start:753 stop:1553 length:801 start_codon:yes stop_codon:yes gene_type:complete
MKILSLIAAGAIVAVAACTAEEAAAADLTGSIELDVAENAAGKTAATKTFGMGVTGVGLGFAGIELDADANNNVIIDEWHVGFATPGLGDLSLGKQGNVWLGVTSAAAYNTTADPAMAESIKLITPIGVTLAMGMQDIGTDLTDLTNIQGTYGMELGAVSLLGALDYNTDTKKYVVGSRVGTEIAGYGTGVAMTYASSAWAYEADATAMGITAYLNGAQDNTFQNVGGKWEKAVGGDTSDVTLGTAMNYDLDAKTLSPSASLSFAF